MFLARGLQCESLVDETLIVNKIYWKRQEKILQLQSLSGMYYTFLVTIGNGNKFLLKFTFTKAFNYQYKNVTLKCLINGGRWWWWRS